MPAVSQKTRAEEVAPYGTAGLSRQLIAGSGRLFLLDSDDPVLARIAEKDPHKVYPALMRHATVAASWGQVIRCLLAYEIELLPASSRRSKGRSPSRAQKRLHDVTLSAWDLVPMRNAVLERALDAVAWGWRPMEVTYSRDLYVGGARYWRPATVREKDPSEFRFNLDRDLCYLGAGSIEVLDQSDDPARWWVCQSGSADNPYGRAEFQAVWLPAYLQKQWFKLWQSAARKAQGVPVISRGAVGEVSLDSPGKAADPRLLIGQLMTEAREVLRVFNEEGVLVKSGRVAVEIERGLVANADSLEGPLAYLDGLIRQVLLHQDMTGASSKDIGSRAAMESSRKGLTDRARGIGDSLVDMLDGLALMLARINFGDDVDPQDVPYFRSRIDRVDILPAAKSLVDMGIGRHIDFRQIAEDSGVPLLDDGEVGLLDAPVVAAPLAAPVDPVTAPADASTSAVPAAPSQASLPFGTI